MHRGKNQCSICENLRMLRDQRNLSQEYMAIKLDISQSSYSCYELNKNKISVDMLLALARILNVSPMQLLGVSDSDQPAKTEHALYEEERLIEKRETFLKNLRTAVEEFLNNDIQEKA